MIESTTGGRRSGIRRAGAPALLGLLLCLAMPSVAGARAFGIGTGDVPDIAIDRGGSAHLAWATHRGVLYCGLYRGGEACGRPRLLGGGGLTAGRPHVLVAGRGRLVVSLGDGPCPEGRPGLCTYVRESPSDGVSFDPPRAIAISEWPGPQPGPSSFGDAVFGPGDSISYASATGAVFFANAPLGDGAGHRFVELADPTPGATGATGVAVGLAGSRPVVVYADTAEPQSLHWQAGSGLAGLDQVAGWTFPRTIASGVRVGENDAVASGPAGLFVMYQRGPAHGVQRFFVRRFTGDGFGPEVPVGEPLRGGDYPIPADLTEDGSGRLHAVWIDYRSHRIRAVASTVGGATWGRPFTIAAGRAVPPGERSVPRLVAAAAPDGLGYVVWVGGSGRGEALRVQAAQLEPHGPHGSCRLPNCLVLGGRQSRARGNLRLGLRVRVLSCRSRRLRAEAKVTIPPRPGRRPRLRLRGTRMRLDGGGPRHARGRPPTATFSFPRGARGASHRVTASVALATTRGGPRRERTVTLDQSFAACP